MTTLSGGGWDALAGNGPDVFLSINSGTSANTNDFLSLRYDNVVGQTLTFSTPVTLPSPSSYWTVGIWDNDTTGNEFMSGVYFIPNDFKNGFPSTITLNTSLMTVELNVTWLF